MASKKSKILAIAFCAAVMAGIHVNPVLAYHGEEDFNYQHNTTESGLNNPEIHHTADEGWVRPDWEPVHPEGDVNCEEEVANSNITVGDMNKVTADLVANDEKIYSDVKDLQEQVNNIETTADTNTQINEGTYTAEADGTVNMDVVDKVTGEVTENAVTIEGLASDSELKAVEDKAENAQNTADMANTKAENAQNTADMANTKAENAQNTADMANTKAENAQNTADMANTKAENAQNTADMANTKAENAQNTADMANTKADRNTESINDLQDVTGAANSGELQDRYVDTNYISGAADMADADVILDREISRVDGRVDRWENRVDGLEDRIDKVGAMSAAIANLRTMGYDPAAPTEVAVGVGQYRDETGMALGLFHYPNRDFMLSLSVSTSGDEYMGGIGATWKFGRKSPEKVAEIKKAQAEADARRAEEQKLAKAEEMKKAAKEAKVQAQMERHAKMLAEQEAQA